MKLKCISEKYKDKPNTYDEIITYLQGHQPTGPYKKLITTFETKGKEGSREDKDFYNWLLDNYETSVALQGLRNTGDFYDFVFNFGGIEPFHNQKWHFYVSYLTFLEYWTMTGDKSSSLYYDEDEDLSMKMKSIRFSCEELKIWWKKSNDKK